MQMAQDACYSLLVPVTVSSSLAHVQDNTRRRVRPAGTKVIGVCKVTVCVQEGNDRICQMSRFFFVSISVKNKTHLKHNYENT